MAKNFALIYYVIYFLFQASPSWGRIIASYSPFEMVSDGVDNLKQLPFVRFERMLSSGSCKETYGFLPCTTTFLGNVFLILVYSYLMFRGAKLLSAGCEILLQILGPGMVGGLFLPLLSAFPDATIILASGISGSRETAQAQVSIGIGLLAGSTVMLLTILWGSCLLVGKSDIENSVAVNQKDTRGFSLTGSGVSTDIWTKYAAMGMIVSLIPFLIVQLSQFFHSTSQSQLAVLFSLIVSVSLFVIYSLCQIFQPWIQRRRLAYVKHKHLMSGVLLYIRAHTLGRLLKDDGEADIDVIQKLFTTLDKDSDGYISATDLRTLIIGMHFEEMNMDINEAVTEVMSELDMSHDSRIDLDEFVNGITRWLHKAMHSSTTANGHGQSPQTLKLLNEYHLQTKQQYELLIDQGDETVEHVENPKWNFSKAVLMLLLGTIIAGVFADPLVDALDNFSTATSIPSFFVSFVILPFASSSEVVSALIFASKKKIRTTSLTYSEIYGSVTMSNILSLSVFLGLVYIRKLTWDFSSEVVVILIVSTVMGAIASFRTTYHLWLSLVAFALYPLSLLLVYILDYVV